MTALRLSLLVTALLSSTLCMAQTTYRWVDKASGQTVFSDQPPPPGARNVVRSTSSERGEESSLPYATRQAAEKFPVTLYTAANCVEECKQARQLLNGRGVPFTEKMLNTQGEIDTLTQLLGADAQVPSLAVGRQSFRGFETGAWNNLLDLAGYPKTAPYGARPSGAFSQ